MPRLTVFLRDSGHLWLLLFVILAGGGTFFLIRARLVPATYGDTGAYRAAALLDNANRPAIWPKDQTCLECHQNVAEERHGSLHEAVRCFHCHGVGTDHIEQARLATQKPGISHSPAVAWDGDFFTKLDLYVTKDRKTCLSCHQDAVGVPSGFKKIQVKVHLEEMGASDPDSPEACFECHKGHNTAP